MPTSRKSRNATKKTGICVDYNNSALPGFTSKTKQLTIKESILDPTKFQPVQGSPQEEIELFKTFFLLFRQHLINKNSFMMHSSINLSVRTTITASSWSCMLTWNSMIDMQQFMTSLSVSSVMN